MAVHLLTELRRAKDARAFRGIGHDASFVCICWLRWPSPAFLAGSAFAQVSGCQEGQKIIAERRSLSEQFAKLTQGKEDRRALRLLALHQVQHQWPSRPEMDDREQGLVPDPRSGAARARDHKQVTKVKGDACQAAAKMAEMESVLSKQQAQQSQQGGMAGKMGGGLTGTLSVPKALYGLSAESLNSMERPAAPSLPDAVRPLGRAVGAALRQPYRLARIERPIGWWLLLLPCWWSAALAACAGRPWPNPLHCLLFLIGAMANGGGLHLQRHCRPGSRHARQADPPAPPPLDRSPSRAPWPSSRSRVSLA